MVSILLSSFVFLSKRYWWTIIANVLLDLWIIANLVYYQANECFLDINAILMANPLAWQNLAVHRDEHLTRKRYTGSRWTKGYILVFPEQQLIVVLILEW